MSAPLMSNESAAERYAQALARLVADPGTRYMLRQRLREDAQRDALDAVQDAEQLLLLAQLRLALVMEQSAGTARPPAAGTRPE